MPKIQNLITWHCAEHFEIFLSEVCHYFQLVVYSRHSRFGGTFVVKNMKSISDRDMIAHKMHKSLNEITFDVNKKPKKKAKNLQPIKDQEVFRRSTLSVRLGLKEFCIQFLENCYNPLMYAVKVIVIIVNNFFLVGWLNIDHITSYERRNYMLQ